MHFRLSRNGLYPCLMTLIYASTSVSLRNQMWEDIANLQVDPEVAWFVLGDFNDIPSIFDQQGGSHHYLRRCINHQRQLHSTNLIDMGASGNKFTLRRNCLRVRLNRCYTNMTRRCSFPNARVTNLPFRHSDHCLTLLEMEGQKYDSSNRPFQMK